MLIGTNGTYPLAATGGAAQVTIATANLPAHNHPIVDPGHTHATATTASNATAGADPVGATAGNTGSSTTGITTGNTGSGNALTTISPYASIQYIIKL
jgi:microcystin-dependent protein